MNQTKNQLAIAAELKQIEDEHEGRLTPEDVISKAKNKDSVLHGLFEWDVKKAAREHWLETARGIIRSVRVEITTSTRTLSTVNYVRDPSLPNNEAGYVSVAKIKTDKEMATEVLLDEITRVISALTRGLEMASYLGMSAPFEAMIAQSADLRRAIESATTEA